MSSNNFSLGLEVKGTTMRRLRLGTKREKMT